MSDLPPEPRGYSCLILAASRADQVSQPPLPPDPDTWFEWMKSWHGTCPHNTPEQNVARWKLIQGEVKRFVVGPEKDHLGWAPTLRAIQAYFREKGLKPSKSWLLGEDNTAPPEPVGDQEYDTQKERQVIDAIQIDVLGKVGYGQAKIFSLYHRSVETITGVSRMKYEDLLEIAGPPARDKVSAVGGVDMPAHLVSMTDVRRAISTLAGYRKISDEIELGAGCWGGRAEDGESHPSVVLVGNREAADWNGDKTLRRIDHPRCRGHLLDFETSTKPWYDFSQLSGYLEQANDKAFREAAMNDCIRLFGRWRWKNEASGPIVLTGLVLATWVQTLWEWRPQVAVTGRTSSGKSMFFKALAGLFGNLSKSCSDATAAGIRQLIENSAKIILFDEFDAEDKYQAEEQKKILKMLRASGRGDSAVRGQSNQKAKESNLRHIVWLAGIQISSPREADRNRYIMIEPLPPVEALKGKLSLPPTVELHELGQRLLATAIYCIHDAVPLAISLKDTRIQGVADRVVESYAVPAAILAAVQGDTEDEARELLGELLTEISHEEAGQQSDEQSLMADILGAQIQIGPSRLSVAQLLETAIGGKTGWESAETALESRGVKLDRFTTGTEARCVLLAPQLVSEHLIKNTRWGGQAIDQIIRRIPTAVHSRRRVGGQRVQTVAISLDLMCNEFLGLSVTAPAEGDRQRQF